MENNEYFDLLKLWCDTLLELQITEIGRSGIYGGIMCPACSRIHGRSADAMYPLMCMAQLTGERRYLDGAKRLFEWSAHMSRPDGSFLNDTSSTWKGITVFAALQLGEAILHHGALLETAELQAWKERLGKAADYIMDDPVIPKTNINYPATASIALAVAGKALVQPRYLERAGQFARQVLGHFTAGHILFGEGKPNDGISPGGCRPVDLGYNVEESLGALVLYGLLTEDAHVLDRVEASLQAHLAFMLPDGAWDNSWGSRSYKWTYWGSRTSDGCQIGYGLMAERSPLFAEAAARNLRLYRECTHDGLLHGGPHYRLAGEPACVHHTFTHAKALAAVLDHPQAAKTGQSIRLPREEAEGVSEYPELGIWLAAAGPWRATIAAGDWEYVRGGTPTGGTLSMLWHQQAGPLFVASMMVYQRIEPDNMQIPMGDNHQPLMPRLEYEENGILYASAHDKEAALSWKEEAPGISFAIRGRMVSAEGNEPKTGQIPYSFTYAFGQETAEIAVRAETRRRVLFRLPLISSHEEEIAAGDGNSFTVMKRGCRVRAEIRGKWRMEEQGVTGRIYNLVPGFEAIPLTVEAGRGEEAGIILSIEKSLDI